MFVKKHVVPAPPKSQYELERDERIKRNEEWMLANGINTRGSYMKQNTKKRGPKKKRKRVRVVDDLSDEQRARLAQFNMDDFYASASAPFTKPRHRRDGVITSSCTHRWMEPDARAKTNKCTTA